MLNTNTPSKSMYKDEHNHEPDVIETAVRQVRSDINLRSTFSRSTKRIITEVVNVYPNEVLHRLQSTNYMAQQIRYKRRKTSEHQLESSNNGFVILPSSTTLQCGGNFLPYERFCTQKQSTY